jgi:2-keto-4-pentenoate hydratase/2-oxohepta-3-ene-1,7-dioic acid hydratase in catechol pathway
MNFHNKNTIYNSIAGGAFRRFIKVILLSSTLLLSVMVNANNDSVFKNIAAVDEALTLAQIKTTKGPASLLVLAQEGQQISAVNLSQVFDLYTNDPLDIVVQVGSEKIRAQAQQSPQRFELSQLIIPTGLSSEQLAAGGNYAAHSEESGLEDVFLFPKYSQPTPGNQALSVNAGQLLDYEIEICTRFDRDIRSTDDFNKATKAFFLCGDFSDRTALMRNIDPDDWESGAGFTDGKSGQGLFPIGFFTVIPNDWLSFLNDIQLQLSVNNDIRQQAKADQMILKIDGILNLALSEEESMRWTYKGKNIPLLTDGIIYKGQSIVTGTPSGVVFRPPENTFIASCVFKWLVTGQFFKQSITDYVIERHIEAGLESKTYLQPGDQITMSASYLGAVEFTVESVNKQ